MFYKTKSQLALHHQNLHFCGGYGEIHQRLFPQSGHQISVSLNINNYNYV
ncbi:GSCOCG00009583001-RA-CDS [Cotesia congregata]|nr:GSCOCG00009583001-RA-CDS [Cotesia congregata]